MRVAASEGADLADSLNGWLELAGRGRVQLPFGLGIFTDVALEDYRVTLLKVGAASVTAAPPGTVARIRE
ncbi:MAG: hypothetical protein ACJ72L_05110 [Marmoricola sp.]